MIRRLIALGRRAADSYGRHACSELAAAIAYRTLFSLVPFVAVLVAVLDATLPDAAREELIGWVLGQLPGSAVQDSVQRELEKSRGATTVAGIIALGTLIWTATGMTRSVRVALAVIWEADRPAFVRARIRDVAALGVLAALVIGVFGLSLITQIAVQLGVDISEALGLGRAPAVLAVAAELATSVAATFAALLLVYRFAAPERSPLARLWPSTLLITVAIDAGVAVYAFYLLEIASFNTVYGPLGAVLAFLALLYFVAMLVLFGAEMIHAPVTAPKREASIE